MKFFSVLLFIALIVSAMAGFLSNPADSLKSSAGTAEGIAGGAVDEAKTVASGAVAKGEKEAADVLGNW
ncbi:hypothetical protein evm_012334 [Chilo suppressalis]|nr:hypothetical protein evm_012334 [Chilo suppressalis]